MKRILLFCSIALCAPAFAKGPAPKAPPKSSETEKVNVLTASQEELERWPGVGPSLAAKILAAREAHKEDFKSCKDLGNVRGIGAAKLAQILPFCTVQGPTTLTVSLGKNGQPQATKEGKSAKW